MSINWDDIADELKLRGFFYRRAQHTLTKGFFYEITNADAFNALTDRKDARVGDIINYTYNDANKMPLFQRIKMGNRPSRQYKAANKEAAKIKTLKKLGLSHIDDWEVKRRFDAKFMGFTPSS